MSQTSDNLTIHQLPLGNFDNFVYILADTSAKQAVVIDPAWDATAIETTLSEHGYTLQAIWLTHGHSDHTSAVADVLAKHDVPLFLNRTMPQPWRPPAASTIEFADGDTLTVGGIAFTVLHTPGHSPDGSCFLHRDQLIAGDTLFIDGCGRCDLPDSDVHAMYHSIHRRLMKLADNTVIYPGHNYGPSASDTLGNQKQTNRFMLVRTEKAFIRERLG